MSAKRMFEFVEGSSSKFWEIWRDGVEVRTRYGRIGSDGQTTLKSEADEAKAQKLYDKLVKEKTGKGYVETAGAGADGADDGGDDEGGDDEAPAKTAKKATTKKATAKKLTGLLPWMATGMGYRSSDFDADDVYVIACSIDDDGNLAVSFGGTAGDGAFVCSASAIESATEKIHVAQGGATLSQDNGTVDETAPTEAFPPFLLSRALFAALKSGQPIAWPTVLSGDGKTVEVTKTGAGTRSISVNGKKQSVKTIEAEGDDGSISLIVLDDASWPLILVNHEADECGWWLKAVGKDLYADAISEMGDDEEEDGDEDEDEDGDEEGGGGGGWRRFEMDEKFWAIKLDGTSHTVKYGKQGSDGQEKTKDFDDEAAAQKDYDKLVKEKTGKGYEEIEG